MNPHVNTVANRLSLRPPQRVSLEILARVSEIISLKKGADPAKALKAISSEFPTVTNFERNFPSLCFALATGVGKTRLMGAFIAWLHKAKGIRHFFVLAPNLTIYDKLIKDFTPNTPKYVFQGIPEFAVNPPEIITGDNYESGRGVRKENRQGPRSGDFSQIAPDQFTPIGEVHINIFNISKINSEVRGGKEPRIKRLQEYIGDSYFKYLSELDDLVLLMDESHRYRASAGVRAINELNPILGLELTATPQVEQGARATPFNNVIYSYPLSSAMTDGFVKEPAVATRENFDVKNYDDQALERLKLEDGIRIHEHTKVELEVFARENQKPLVKPFMLVVANDTTHADSLRTLIEEPNFFEGRYKGKAITVHSNLRGEERDDTVAQLISVEDRNNPTEIVIHVNMLKEGWDVTNLYTIVPLRAANSKTLVEQSIGRGLRLPYSRRTGRPAVDRLTIVSHDRFQEIVDEANRPDSIIKTGIVIGRDIPAKPSKVVTVTSLLDSALSGTQSLFPTAEPTPRAPVYTTPKEQQIALKAMEVARQYENDPKRVPTIEALKTPEIKAEIARKVEAALHPLQTELPEAGDSTLIAEIVGKTIDLQVELSIDIPRILVVPVGEVQSGFADFDLDVSGINLQPVAKDILIHHLRTSERHRLVSGDGVIPEDRLEDYLVSGLIDFDDINYDDHSNLLYKLAGQVVARIQSYLSDPEAVLNVLQFHQQTLVKLIHAQMLEHYQERATSYEARVSKGFTTLHASSFAVPADEAPRNFRAPVDEKLLIKGLLFSGFRKCLYPAVKFDSDTERRFSVILEDAHEVLKWFRPAKSDLQIHYAHDSSYEPDFVVETKTRKFLCELKRASDIDDSDVQAKSAAAVTWCCNASTHAAEHGAKPWSYVLIPHDAIAANKTFENLTTTYAVKT